MEDNQIAHLADVFDAVGAVRINVVKDTDYRNQNILRTTSLRSGQT